MIKTIWKRDFQMTKGSILAILAILSLYTTVIIYLFDPKMADVLNDFQKALPEMMSMVGMSGIASTLIEWIQIYLYGFIMLLFPMIFIVVIVNQVLMRHIDSGSFVSFLMVPISRTRLFWIQVGYIYMVLFGVMAFMSIEAIIVSNMLFPNALDVSTYLVMNMATLLLWWGNASIAVIAVCFAHNAKRYYFIGAGVPVLFLLLHMLGNMSDSLSWFHSISMYSLISFSDIISHQASIGGVFVLIISMMFFMISAHQKFIKRDFYI